ncbi:hypothetical protein PENTCL1PPCAC_26015, partial [Pristionchus entomophagus]
KCMYVSLSLLSAFSRGFRNSFFLSFNSHLPVVTSVMMNIALLGLLLVFSLGHGCSQHTEDSQRQRLRASIKNTLKRTEKRIKMVPTEGTYLELNITLRGTPMCKPGLADQACCIASSKWIRLEDEGFPNIISPSDIRVSWCEGTCKRKTSFEPLLDDGKDGEGCCLTTEFAPIEIMFTTHDHGLRMDFLHDLLAVECACG